jgi:hypothetical protein
MRRFS